MTIDKLIALLDASLIEGINEACDYLHTIREERERIRETIAAMECEDRHLAAELEAVDVHRLAETIVSDSSTTDDANEHDRIAAVTAELSRLFCN